MFTLQKMKNWIKLLYYRWSNYNKNVTIGNNVIFNIPNTFEGNNLIGDNAMIGKSDIGLGSYIGPFSVIKSTRIGRFCSIGSNIQTGIGTHPAKIFVSTHPAFFSTELHAGFTFAKSNIFAEHIFIGAEKKHVVIIGNDVWIGNNVLVMDGVTIGDGAIIAAGAVVTKDVPPYTIVGGLPAKFLRRRFNEEQTAKLLEIKWWNWGIEMIKVKRYLFNDIDNFIASVGK